MIDFGGFQIDKFAAIALRDGDGLFGLSDGIFEFAEGFGAILLDCVR